MTTKQNQDRFSDRVSEYVGNRPSYPTEVVSRLIDEFELKDRNSTIIDLGSGTGIFCKQLLDALPQATVIGVEPNAGMKEAGDAYLKAYREQGRFSSVQADAEKTTLPDHSADVIVAATAFHWFDRVQTRVECLRLLRDSHDGGVALIWNHRQGIYETDKVSPFMAGYERLLRQYSKDYAAKKTHANVQAQVLEEFFGSADYRCFVCENTYRLDFDQLQGRMLSSSYSPHPGQDGFTELVAGLQELYTEHEITDDKPRGVDFVYLSRAFLGRLSQD